MDTMIPIFFFQAEDGIRDIGVTGVQTCALPILERAPRVESASLAAKHARPNASQRLLVRALQYLGDTPPMPPYGDSAGAVLQATHATTRVETLRLVLDAEALSERDRLGRFLPWLATIGSASPLIGLLGTVLGVINAFVG